MALIALRTSHEEGEIQHPWLRRSGRGRKGKRGRTLRLGITVCLPGEGQRGICETSSPALKGGKRKTQADIFHSTTQTARIVEFQQRGEIMGRRPRFQRCPAGRKKKKNERGGGADLCLYRASMARGNVPYDAAWNAPEERGGEEKKEGCLTSTLERPIERRGEKGGEKGGRRVSHIPYHTGVEWLHRFIQTYYRA